MTLAEYFKKHGVTVQQFADQIGISYEGVRLLLQHRRMPRQETMAKIADATKGKVSIADFYNGAV
jgi:transcriptional regulator with XRE-family HTH domain